MSCVAVHECKGASVGIILACVRDGGMNKNNIVNVCARKGEGPRSCLQIKEVSERVSGGKRDKGCV